MPPPREEARGGGGGGGEADISGEREPRESSTKRARTGAACSGAEREGQNQGPYSFHFPGRCLLLRTGSH